jgi:YVTN family beta-propeller protein
MIFVSVVTVMCNNAIAQTLEHIKEKRKGFENNPQIEVGKGPSAIADNYETNKIYVANTDEGTVSVIDGDSGAAKKIRVGTTPSSIAIDLLYNKIYVANKLSNSVSVIDGYNDSQIAVVPVGKSPSLLYMVRAYINHTQLQNKIYVLNSGDGTVSVIQTLNDKRLYDIPVGQNPRFISIDPETDMIYVAGYNTVSVINSSNDKREPYNIPIEADPSYMAVLSKKIYVANSDATVSVIDTDSGNIKNITLGGVPTYIGAVSDSNEVYVANSELKDNGTISIIHGNSGDIKNITVGEDPTYIEVDTGTIGPGIYPRAGIYVVNSNHGLYGTVTVIPKGNEKDRFDIPVGKEPTSLDFVSEMIYVVNRESNSLSVIDSLSGKIAAGVNFKVYPGNSGTIICGTDKEKYPTNTYVYVDAGTNCIAQPNKDFQFSGWAENLGGNSTIPLGTSSNLTVNRYGTFTANFKPLSPTDPTQFLLPLYGIIISSLFGWSIPSIIGRIKARTQRKHLKECINDIGILDKNALEEKITGYYIDGKINEEQRHLLKDKISDHYESVKDPKRSPL